MQSIRGLWVLAAVCALIVACNPTSEGVADGVDASVGSVGDGYDNALAESTIGLYKTELINRHGPWKTLAEVELATLEYIDWYNNARLHSACGWMPPAEFEEAHQQALETQ